MKKLVSISILVLMCAGIAFGQQKVAVYVTGGQDAGINKVLGDKLVAAFTKSGRYVAIERTNSFLAELGKEQDYQRTGAVDDRQISRLGKQFGVQLVCVAEVSEVFGQKYVSARLIDVESAEVLNTANTISSLKDMQELLKVSEKITTELTGKTAKEKAAEEIAAAKVKENGFYILDNLAVTIAMTGNQSWEAAKTRAQICSFGGYRDWRIPTLSELMIINESRKIIWNTPKDNGSPFKYSADGGLSVYIYAAWSSDVCESGQQVFWGNGKTECYNLSKNAVIILVREIQ